MYQKVKDCLRNIPISESNSAENVNWKISLPETPFDEVYPGIFLGDRSLALNKPRLQRVGITHVLNTAQGSVYNQVDTSAGYYIDAGIHFHSIPASDVEEFELSTYFQDASDFIEGALHSGGKVYVHCMMGISRSATIVIAYFMMKQNMPILDAVKTVRAERPVFPNNGFVRQLCTLHQQLFDS